MSTPLDESTQQISDALCERCASDELQMSECTELFADLAISTHNECMDEAARTFSQNDLSSSELSPWLPSSDTDHDKSHTTFGISSPALPSEPSTFCYNSSENKNGVALCSEQPVLNHVNGQDYPEDSKRIHGENKWSPSFVPLSPDNEQLLNYYIRNQSRSSPDSLGQSEAEIQLHDLRMGNTMLDNERFWYHATDWIGAQGIIKSGPTFRCGEESDFASHGAFYLNDSYVDAYAWFRAQNKRFRGYHAMIVFKFDPWKLSGKGEELSRQVWQNETRKLWAKKRRNGLDWSFVPQNADPKNAIHTGRHQKVRWINKTDYAKQLVIHCQTMCSNIHQCLVGCVYYQAITIRNIDVRSPLHPSPSSTAHQNADDDDDDDDEGPLAIQPQEDESDDDSNAKLADATRITTRRSRASKQERRSVRNRDYTARNSKRLRTAKHNEFQTKKITVDYN